MNRRTFVSLAAESLAAGSLAAVPRDRRGLQGDVNGRPRPSPSQLAWQRDELALFLHFGVNTFTDREWGDGREDPAISPPARLEGREWARTAGAWGFRALILTAKHH